MNLSPLAKKTMLGIFALVTILLMASGCGIYEELRYEVVEKYESFELRRYSSHIVAEMEVDSNFDDAGNEAFRPLFKFITGENQTEEDISMTIPVNQQKSEGQEIAMTAPVTQKETGEGKYKIAFVMPSKFTMETLPKPTNPKVKIREVPEKWMAALIYHGGWGQSRYNTKEKLLLESIDKKELKPIGSPIFARHNSPFTLWFLRKNEVIIEVEKQ